MKPNQHRVCLKRGSCHHPNRKRDKNADLLRVRSNSLKLIPPAAGGLEVQMEGERGPQKLDGLPGRSYTASMAPLAQKVDNIGQKGILDKIQTNTKNEAKSRAKNAYSGSIQYRSSPSRLENLRDHGEEGLEEKEEAELSSRKKRLLYRQRTKGSNNSMEAIGSGQKLAIKSKQLEQLESFLSPDVSASKKFCKKSQLKITTFQFGNLDDCENDVGELDRDSGGCENGSKPSISEESFEGLGSGNECSSEESGSSIGCLSIEEVDFQRLIPQKPNKTYFLERIRSSVLGAPEASMDHVETVLSQLEGLGYEIDEIAFAKLFFKKKRNVSFSDYLLYRSLETLLFYQKNN